MDYKTINKKPTHSKIYIREKKYITTFHTPNNTIYVHRNTKRIIATENPYHQDTNRFRNLKIWKLFDIKTIYQRRNEKIIYKIEAIEEKTRNIIKTRIQKDKQSKKLFQGNRNQCEAKKMKKLIVLNYTERGKRQKSYNYLYTISILYTYTLPIFFSLHLTYRL